MQGAEPHFYIIWIYPKFVCVAFVDGDETKNIEIPIILTYDTIICTSSDREPANYFVLQCSGYLINNQSTQNTVCDFLNKFRRFARCPTKSNASSI